MLSWLILSLALVFIWFVATALASLAAIIVLVVLDIGEPKSISTGEGVFVGHVQGLTAAFVIMYFLPKLVEILW